MQECEKYYQLGLEAEKKLLPFFLPYEFPPKRTLESVLKLWGFTQEKASNNNNSNANKPNNNNISTNTEKVCLDYIE